MLCPGRGAARITCGAVHRRPGTLPKAVFRTVPVLQRTTKRCCAAPGTQAERPLGLPLPDHDDLHDLVVDVGVRHWRALDEQAVAFEADEPRLLAANPRFVPGGFDLGDDLAVLDPVAAGIGDHGL